MRKAIWSKLWLDDSNEESVKLYQECIEDLIDNEMVKALDDFSQHVGTSRLQHSINVSYYSFLMCRNLGLDYKSAARAGLLHDLFLYDWRKVKHTEGNHAVVHPKVAHKNAKSITKLNKIEEEAILKHMWPISFMPPRYAESYIVTLADKYCACAEVAYNYTAMLFENSTVLKRFLLGGVYCRNQI